MHYLFSEVVMLVTLGIAAQLIQTFDQEAPRSPPPVIIFIGASHIGISPYHGSLAEWRGFVTPHHSESQRFAIVPNALEFVESTIRPIGNTGQKSFVHELCILRAAYPRGRRLGSRIITAAYHLQYYIASEKA